MLGDTGFMQPHGPGPVEVLSSQDSAAGIGSMVGSWGNIDDQAAETYGIVVGYRGLVGEADCKVTFFGADFSEHTSRMLRRFGETEVEARQEDTFDPCIGLFDLGDPFHGHFGYQAILEGAALTFDTSFGLSRVGGDGFDAQLLEDTTDVGGETDTGQLFFMAPVGIVAVKRAVTILVDRGGDPMVSQDHVQQPEIADGILMRSEQHPQHDAGGIVGSMEETAGRALRTEPSVGAAIPLHHEPHLGTPSTPAPMPRRTPPPLGPNPCLPQPAANCLPADPKTFPFLQHFDKMSIVELGIPVLMNRQDPLTNQGTKGIMRRTAPMPMSQAGGPFTTISRQQSLGLAVADLQDICPHHKRQGSFAYLLHNPKSTHFTFTQDYQLLHALLLSEGDILAWQLMGTL